LERLNQGNGNMDDMHLENDINDDDKDILDDDDVNDTGMEYEERLVIVKRIKDNIKKSDDHLSGWLGQAVEDFDFFAGNQWSETDKAKLKEENRPAIVFNRIVRTINAVTGLELQNRQETVYIPREQGDAITNELLTGAAQWARDNCDAQDEESQAFKECLICGVGAMETRLDYEVDQDGAIIIERVDPLEMRWDPASSKRNIDDSKWRARIKQFTKTEFKELWPDQEVTGSETINKGTGLAGGGRVHDQEAAKWYKNNQGTLNYKKDLVDVIQYQEWERVCYYRIERMNGEIEEISKDKYKEVKQLIQQMRRAGLVKQVAKQYRRVYKQYFLYGDSLLESGNSPIDGFTLHLITGAHDRNNGLYFGLVRLMRDPQMWANKWLSQVMHIVNSNAKGGYFYETGAFANPRKASQDIANTSKNVELNPGGMSKLKPKEAPRYPEGIDRLLNYAMEAINSLVGVNLEMLGSTAGGNQSGYLEMQRKQAGITVLADFFDGLRRYRKEQGRGMGEFIVKYIADGRLVRIAGDDMGKYVPLLKDEMSFKYDVIVDEAATSPNQKEQVFRTLSGLIPTLMQAGIPIPPEILDYAPIPASLATKWKKLINEPDPKAGEVEKMREQLAQLAIAEKTADVEKKQSETNQAQYENAETQSQVLLNQAKALKEQALAQDEAAQAQQKMSLGAMGQLAKDQATAREQQRRDFAATRDMERKDAEAVARMQREEAKGWNAG